MLPFNKIAEVEDFADPGFREVLRRVFPHELARFGPDYPLGHEYRKDWEVAMAVRALAEFGALHREAEILGVGAGNEPTSFYLTNFVRRVFATDLFLSEEWAESASPGMMIAPERYWPSPWDRRRLVAQQMNALDLWYVDGSFDGVYSSGSLEHFGNHADIRRSVREMHRVLKPGGILSVSTEFRIEGPSPGMPGVLMFDESEIEELIFGAANWEATGPLSLGLSPATRASVQQFDDLAGNVRDHVARHGEILFHKLNWKRYPVLLLRHGPLVWGSGHIALRKVT